MVIFRLKSKVVNTICLRKIMAKGINKKSKEKSKKVKPLLEVLKAPYAGAIFTFHYIHGIKNK